MTVRLSLLIEGAKVFHHRSTANELTVHLVLGDFRRPWTPDTLEEFQVASKLSLELAQPSASTPAAPRAHNAQCENLHETVSNKEGHLNQIAVVKIMRNITTKRRELQKLRKNLITLQNTVLEQYASLKELEIKAGVTQDESDNIRILSLKGWKPHDILMLLRFGCKENPEETQTIDNQVMEQMSSHLTEIPAILTNVASSFLNNRTELINLLKNIIKSRNIDRTSHVNLKQITEWKSKQMELEQETEKLNKFVADTAENLMSQINFILGLARIPWNDRNDMSKQINRLNKENSILQNKLEESNKSNVQDSACEEGIETKTQKDLLEELHKERSARESLKEVVTGAENMLRSARARIANLERQLKESKSELESTRRKQKELEQLYRHRENSYDARSKKLIEVKKTSEMTIEALTRQRDALELRVKELHEQVSKVEEAAMARESDLKGRADSLQSKLAEHEKLRSMAEKRIADMAAQKRSLEEKLNAMKEKSSMVVEIERRRVLDFLPGKECEPSTRDTELWKELQLTRAELTRVEEELKTSRADKDSFLESLSRIAQGESDNLENKMATELLNKERKISRLQRTIEELKENEKIMEDSMTQYENQLAVLRLEVKKLRNYDCYSKDVPHQQLQTELVELQMRVETLTRERAALISAAASRALMLERHERAAELFAKITRTRKELSALVQGTSDPPPGDEFSLPQISRSLSAMCTSAADTWSALQLERARVLRLESAVVAQNLQLEREDRVRTQLERRRSMLERQIIRSHINSHNSQEPSKFMKRFTFKPLQRGEIDL